MTPEEQCAMFSRPPKPVFRKDRGDQGALFGRLDAGSLDLPNGGLVPTPAGQQYSMKLQDAITKGGQE